MNNKEEWLLKHGYKKDKMVRDVYIKHIPKKDLSLCIKLWEGEEFTPQSYIRSDFPIDLIGFEDYRDFGVCFNILKEDFRQMMEESK